MEFQEISVLELRKLLRTKIDLYADINGMSLKIVKSDFIELISHLSSDTKLKVNIDDHTVWLS